MCYRCSTSCEDQPDGVVVQRNNFIPICAEVPEGVDGSSKGVVLESLKLAEGYFRVSTLSHGVLECHQSKACKGGVDTGDYCAEGYQGPCELLECRRSNAVLCCNTAV